MTCTLHVRTCTHKHMHVYILRVCMHTHTHYTACTCRIIMAVIVSALMYTYVHACMTLCIFGSGVSIALFAKILTDALIGNWTVVGKWLGTTCTCIYTSSYIFKGHMFLEDHRQQIITWRVDEIGYYINTCMIYQFMMVPEKLSQQFLDTTGS